MPSASEKLNMRKPHANYRWVICALIFTSTTLSYIDRQILGLLKPILEADLGWSETSYGDVVATFSLFYALGYLFAGRVIDWIGVKRGLALAVTGWSLAAAAHGLMGSILGFKIARGVLGMSEGGNFPAAIKAVREWFPPQERALATGLFNAGSNIGAIITPLTLPFIVIWAGWRAAFFIAGGLGIVWLILWLRYYDRPERQARLSGEELAYIRSGEPLGEPDAEQQTSWLSLLKYRGTWAYIVGMLLTGPVWWFYLNWVPGFLHDRFGVNMLAATAPIITIYLIADVGSIGGGWLSSRMIARGISPISARLWAMFILALFPVGVVFIAYVPGLWPAVLLIALAAAGHQGLAANLFTLVTDTVPTRGVSSVIGMGGFAAGIAGMFTAMAIGRLLDATGNNYTMLFYGAAFAYPLAVGLMIVILRTPKDLFKARKHR